LVRILPAMVRTSALNSAAPLPRGSKCADPDGIADARERVRANGLRWTPQRDVLLRALAASDEHVGGAELVKLCRDMDATTTPSTVYRNLDLLERLGIVSHHRHPSGREEFHYRNGREHVHLYCRACGRRWEVSSAGLARMIDVLRRDCGFEADICDLALVGLCGECSAEARTPGSDGARPSVGHPG